MRVKADEVSHDFKFGSYEFMFETYSLSEV